MAWHGCSMLQEPSTLLGRRQSYGSKPKVYPCSGVQPRFGWWNDFFVEHVDLIISYVLIIIDKSFNDSNCGGIIEKGWLMICPGIVLPNILGTIIIHYGNSLLTSHCEGTTDGFEHCWYGPTRWCPANVMFIGLWTRLTIDISAINHSYWSYKPT